ncbi:outer membrane beta-barrel protein [Psychromonas aquimarina]|uniref:outer membrane beta-barrel protein n=1 Tax=Psychromonas aquimarina TaxID=444919 RepID=UPI0004280B95|nr:OmpA family protein [Psychromonas aquimarina]
MTKVNYILPVALLFSGAVTAASENPWYAGARLGGTYYNDLSSNMLDANTLDKNDVGGGVFLGYNFVPWFALETGYTYLGKMGPAEIENMGSIKQQGMDLVGKFTWNASDSLDIFAKAGAFYYKADGQDQLSAYDDSGVAATAGLGLEYFLTKNISTRLEYQFYNELELQDAGMNSSWNTHFYGLSLVYGWGAPAPVVVQDAPMAEPEPEPMVEPEPEPEPVVLPAMVKVEPLTVELPFAFDSDELPQEYLDQLAPIAEHLIEYPEAELFVIGHTDSRGPEAYNQKLSEERAALIGEYLAAKFNIDKSRIVEEGRGELEPRATNDTDEGRALNRRVSVYTPGLEVQNK